MVNNADTAGRLPGSNLSPHGSPAVTLGKSKTQFSNFQHGDVRISVS